MAIEQGHPKPERMIDAIAEAKEYVDAGHEPDVVATGLEGRTGREDNEGDAGDSPLDSGEPATASEVSVRADDGEIVEAE